MRFGDIWQLLLTMKLPKVIPCLHSSRFFYTPE